MSKVEKIAAIVWAALYIIGIQQCYHEKRNTKEFLAEPRVGDLYVVKVAHIDGGGYEGEDARFIGIMKLIEVDENILTFVISKKAYSRREDLHLAKEYSDNILRLQRNVVYSLYENDSIEEIQRK